MFKHLMFLAALALASTAVNAQRYFTRDGKVDFDATSKGSPEKINAKHNAATLVYDKATGNVQVVILIKGFLFPSALMQEHFNENYMESSKFPKAEFKGKLAENDKIDLSKDGTYSGTVNGDLTMHGVTKPVSLVVNFDVKGGAISGNAKFALVMADFGIAIPSLVADKVSKTAKINVAVDLKPMDSK